jgi:hypothetical protein
MWAGIVTIRRKRWNYASPDWLCIPVSGHGAVAVGVVILVLGLTFVVESVVKMAV